MLQCRWCFPQGNRKIDFKKLYYYTIHTPWACDNVPIGLHADSPHRLSRMGDGLATVAILPHTQCPVFPCRHKASWHRGQEGDGIDKVGVWIARLCALARRQPALHSGIIGAGQELRCWQHGQASHAVCVAWNMTATQIANLKIPPQFDLFTCLISHQHFAYLASTTNC